MFLDWIDVTTQFFNLKVPYSIARIFLINADVCLFRRMVIIITVMFRTWTIPGTTTLRRHRRPSGSLHKSQRRVPTEV